MNINHDKPRLGTDEAFLQVMTVTGPSLLKLFGLPQSQAEKYRFRAVVLKEKTLKPDIEGFPILESEDGRIFLEFQGYPDPFIRQRVMAEVFLGCVNEKYTGQVMAGIVYTEAKYQQAALPLNSFLGTGKRCQCQDCFREVVLSQYTERQLLNIDPKLVILAPFTVSAKLSHPQLLAKGQAWREVVTQTFSEEEQPDALNVLGLFILNQFRSVNYQEVMTMLYFDLLETRAGQDMYKMGAINNAQEAVVDVLKTRFGHLPRPLIAQIRQIDQQRMLKKLHRDAIRCSTLDQFRKELPTSTRK